LKTKPLEATGDKSRAFGHQHIPGVIVCEHGVLEIILTIAG